MQYIINDQTRRPITPTEWKRVVQRDNETVEQLGLPDNMYNAQLADQLDRRELIESNTVFWKEW